MAKNKNPKEIIKPTGEEKNLVSLPNFVTENKPTKQSSSEIVGTTQTQTFENEFLKVLVSVLNERVKNTNLEIPTTKLKGTKKQLFKICFSTLFTLLGYNPNEIENFLTIGKYIK